MSCEDELRALREKAPDLEDTECLKYLRVQ